MYDREECIYYNENDGVYPLCKGNKEIENECHHCLLYEDYEKYNGEEYYER